MPNSATIRFSHGGRLYLQKPQKAYRHLRFPIPNSQLPITHYPLPDIPHLYEKGYNVGIMSQITFNRTLLMWQSETIDLPESLSCASPRVAFVPPLSP